MMFARPALAQEAGQGVTSTEVVANEPIAVPGLEFLSGIKDVAELSLEELLNAEMTTSTRSKPMRIRDSPNVMTLVTREEIQRSGARELADVLRLVPGFQLGGDLYSSVFAGFRGIWGSEGKLMVLLDGHEMFELLYYATELGNRVPVDQIERIEIVRGPGSVVYGGSAELAVVNIITRGAEEIEGAAVTGVYGQMLDGSIHEGQPLAKTFARRTVSAEFGKTFGGPDGLRLKAGIFAGQGNRSDQNYTDMKGTRYNFAGNARTDPMLVNTAADWRGLSVRYLFEYYRTTMRDGYDLALADTLPVNYLNSSLNLSYTWQLPHGLKVVPRFHWLYQKPWRTATDTALTLYPSLYWKPIAQRMLGGITATWDVGKSLNLLAGAEYFVDSATDTVIGFVDLGDPSRLTSKVSYRDATLYGQALLETPWANISAGARYEYRSQVGGSFVPRLGFTKTFGPFHYKVLANRAFRAPSISDLATTPDVKSELTTVYEVELGYKLHPSLFAVVNVYDITIKHPFVYFYDSASGVDGYRNHDEGLGTRGAEIELRFRSDRLFANLGYSYYTAAGKQQIDSLAVPGNRSVLLGFSPHKVALLAGLGLSRNLDASASASILGPRRFGYYAYDAGGSPLVRDFGSEVLLNAYLCYKDLFAPGWFTGVGIYNLANTSTHLIQPFNNGHSPIPGPSREIFVRIGYDVRRTTTTSPGAAVP